MLDETGRRPTPPAPAYEQIIHGRPWVLLQDGTRADANEGEVFNDFNDGELIYLPRNPRGNKAYGFSPVEQIVTTINIGLRRQTKEKLKSQLPKNQLGTSTLLGHRYPTSWTKHERARLAGCPLCL